MNINYKKLGKRIRIARKKKHLTQEVLAEKVDCSPSFISYVETGRKEPSLERFVQIANTLDCTADELLIDSLWNNMTVRGNKFSVLMEDCEQFETQILYDVIGAMKAALRKYAKPPHSIRKEY